jgi:hypothetical protein
LLGFLGFNQCWAILKGGLKFSKVFRLISSWKPQILKSGEHQTENLTIDFIPSEYHPLKNL